MIKDDKIIYEEPAALLNIESQTNLARLQAAGAVSLGKNLEAGNHILQIIATDKTNPKRFASQFVEFGIVE